MKQFSTLLLIGLLSFNVWAEDNVRYIRDVLYVPMRSGKTNANRILQMLKSGTQVYALDTDEEHTLVRTSKGEEGWIETQYLMSKPTAALQLSTANQKVNQLVQENKPLKEKIHELESTSSKQASELSQLSKQNARLEKELANIKSLSSNAIALDRNNKDLLKKNELLKNEVDILTADNARLKENAQNEGMINGVIAVGFGVLLTLVVPRLAPRRRRNSEWA